MKPTTIVVIVCVILLTIFAMQNTDAVIVNVLFWHPSFPLIILILLVLGIGFAAGFFARSIMKLVSKKGDDF